MRFIRTFFILLLSIASLVEPTNTLADDVIKIDWNKVKQIDAGNKIINWLLSKPVSPQTEAASEPLQRVGINHCIEQYSGLITSYAEEYGISGFKGVIKAVCMQESSGGIASPDIMQASECKYNAKYPAEPNGIQDPAYSLKAGIHYLSDCLYIAGCSSASDTGRLKLALQGYNMGTGYINWACWHYGGYSPENAAEFAGIQKEKLGWQSYGDIDYPAHVMQYYTPFQYFSQTDPKWRYDSYGPAGTIGNSGCGPSALAIAISSLTGDAITPDQVAKWAEDRGYVDENGSSYHSLIPAAAEAYGLNVATSDNPAVLTGALKAGKMIVALMGKGHFVDGPGHFIVLRGIDPDGRIIVADPASTRTSGQAWDLKLILDESKTNCGSGGPFWILSA